MTVAKKVLAVLLSIVMAFSVFTMATSADSGFEPIDKNMGKILDIFEAVENILEAVENLVTKIVNFFKRIFGLVTDRNFYDVEVVHNEHGTVIPITGYSILEKTSFICEIFPEEGYYVKAIMFGDRDITDRLVGTHLVTPDLTSNITLTIVFDRISYTISVAVSGMGSVSPSPNASVLYGENASFTVTPSTGYELVSVVYNGKDVTSQLVDGVFTTPAVFSNGTLVATFEESVPVNVVYVAADGAGDGSSWDSAFGSIQAAIDAAAATEPKGVVWVKAGTYTVSSTIVCKPGVNVYGGFAGTEERASDRQRADLDGNGLVEPWEFANATVIRPSAANVIALRIPSTITADVIVDGFTFTNGHLAAGTNLVQVYGNAAAGGRGILKNSSIVDSKNTGAGGRTRQTTGIVFVDGGTVDSCYLANNDSSGSYGGGAISTYHNYSEASPIYITNCKFVNNKAVYGGGVYFRGNTYYLTNSIFIGNEAGGASDSKGGAVFFTGGSNPAAGRVDNNTFIGNTAPEFGGLYLKADATATRNLFLNNSQSGTVQYGGDGTFTDNAASFVDNLAAAGINSYYFVSADSDFYNYGAVPVGTPAN
ncbi:MAG TPA: hypothetical protein PLK93_03575 [Clostridiales bacterium]|nr:hypothetical protein [Clostridiales bacterium]